MPKILFISSSTDEQNDNTQRLPRCFESKGWSVSRALHESIALHDGNVTCISADHQRHRIIEYDLIWMLGFGEKHTFLDRMQLLRSIPASKWVNAIDAFVYLHGKAGLLVTALEHHHPETTVSNDSCVLTDLVMGGGEWIAKPTAGSFGRDVFLVSKSDINLMSILESMCRQGMVMLQRRAETSHESRWLIVEGQALTAYGKMPIDHRGNLASGASFVLKTTNPGEHRLAQSIATELAELGIRFAAIDVAYPFLLDVNFVNPGWLASYEKLARIDYSEKVAELLIAGASFRHQSE